jgi:hypothetical protein
VESVETEDDDPAEAEAAMSVKVKCEAGKLVARRLSDPDEDHAASPVKFASRWIAELFLLREFRFDGEVSRGEVARREGC